MSDSINNDMSPVYKKSRNRDGPSKDDTRFEYHRMVKSLLGDPRSIRNFGWLLHKILKPLAETKGELLISNGGTKIYFAHERLPFTDFGTIPLATIKVHFLNQTKYYVELLVLSQDAEPVTIRVGSKNIESGQWIEDLGVYYIYERRELGRFNVLIRTMAKYAPVQDEYQYSGWILGTGGFYIMNGRQLRGEDWDIERAEIFCMMVTNQTECAMIIIVKWCTKGEKKLEKNEDLFGYFCYKLSATGRCPGTYERNT